MSDQAEFEEAEPQDASPQRVRVIRSSQDAEESAARFLHSLGLGGIRLTPPSADGGVDIEATGYVVQVKATYVKTSESALRDLCGVADRRGVQPMFFSTAGFTGPSLNWANSHPVGFPLFALDEFGEWKPQNRASTEMAEGGPVRDSLVEPDETDHVKRIPWDEDLPTHWPPGMVVHVPDQEYVLPSLLARLPEIPLTQWDGFTPFRGDSVTPYPETVIFGEHGLATGLARLAVPPGRLLVIRRIELAPKSEVAWVADLVADGSVFAVSASSEPMTVTLDSLARVLLTTLAGRAWTDATRGASERLRLFDRPMRIPPPLDPADWGY